MIGAYRATASDRFAGFVTGPTDFQSMPSQPHSTGFIVVADTPEAARYSKSTRHRDRRAANRNGAPSKSTVERIVEEGLIVAPQLAANSSGLTCDVRKHGSLPAARQRK